MANPPTIHLLLTGTELMLGQTIDSNSALIGQMLNQHGYAVQRKVTVGDDLDLLSQTIDTLCQQADVLIVNGGLGPTVDDFTAQAVAQACQRPRVEHPIAKKQLQQWCEHYGTSLNQANLKQAMLPEDVAIIGNDLGSAPGFYTHHHDCLIIAPSGVPAELASMLTPTIVDLIKRHYPLSSSPYNTRLHTYGIGEADLQTLINTHCPDWPTTVTLGFYSGFPLLEIRLSVQSDAHKAQLEQCRTQVVSLVQDELIGTDDITLTGRIITLLAKQGKTLTTAESCTGGLVAALLTAEPSASVVFDAGFVTYSNAAKQALLGVDTSILDQHSAVSRATVLAMAQGALKRSGADYAVALSGVAGPDGGSEEKPVGTVWIAWGQIDTMQAAKVQLIGNRNRIQKRAASMALDLIRREIQAISNTPRYLRA